MQVSTRMMGLPGLRIVAKYWKRYAFVLLLASCFAVTVIVVRGWMLDESGDVYINVRELPINPVKAPIRQDPPVIVGADGQVKKLDTGSEQVKDSQKPKTEQEKLSLKELEMRNAKLEVELKYEKLKAELLNRDLSAAKKFQNKMKPTKPTQPSKALKPGEEVADDDTVGKLQERRRDTIKRICREGGKDPGAIHTVMKSRLGVTYCFIPGVMDTFWLRVMRFVNRDYVLDVNSPLEISRKDAHERPFIRLKQLRWIRLSEDDKTDILKTKIFMNVENPFMRLWESYIHNLILPTLWSTVGISIESKRKANELLAQTGGKKKFCGRDITFEEFVVYALNSYEASYESYHRLCDPCQLTPTFIVKTETARGDTEKVLYPLNLDWVVKAPSYSNHTHVQYIEDLIHYIHPRFKRSRAENCATPGDIGRSLWRALKMAGLIRESETAPLVDDSKTPDKLIEMITKMYVGANLNVEAQRARMMANAYKTVSKKNQDAIKKKYAMDFKLFEYSENVDDVVKGL